MKNKKSLSHLKLAKKSIIKTIDEYIRNNILKEYLTEYKKEVHNIMTYSIDHQKLATEMYERSLRAEGKQEGVQESIIHLFKKKLLELKDAANEPGMSEKEFLKLAK